MKKLLLVPMLCLGLGGCITLQDMQNAVGVASAAVNAGRDEVRSYCASLGTSQHEAEALAIARATKDCRAIARVQAVVAANRAVCSHVDTLTPSQLYSAGRAMVLQWKLARDAVVAGC